MSGIVAGTEARLGYPQGLTFGQYDGVTPIPAGTPAPGKVELDLPRYAEVMERWRNNSPITARSRSG